MEELLCLSGLVVCIAWVLSWLDHAGSIHVIPLRRLDGVGRSQPPQR